MFNALRSIVFFAWVTAVVVPYAIVVLMVSWMLKPNAVYWLCAGYLRICIWSARLICGVKYRLSGMEHLPTVASMAPVILCPKHQSAWETLAFPTIMSHPLAYVFKRELLRVPFFGWAMGRMDMIHIDRGNRAEAWNKVAAQGKRLLDRGVWVIMFPEGTRIERGAQGQYKSGASRLAVATGASLVPIAVSSAKCWPRKQWILKPGIIDVSIGQPITSQGRDADDLMRDVERWIETEMRRLDPEAYGPQANHEAARTA